MRTIALLTLIGLLPACTYEGADGRADNEQAASNIARRCFYKNTDDEIKDYSVYPFEHDRLYWQFVFQGEGVFARPGYHWWIRIDRETGECEFAAGQ